MVMVVVVVVVTTIVMVVVVVKDVVKDHEIESKYDEMEGETKLSKYN